MAFVNTLDAIGDDAYMDLLLSGEITEVRDAYVTNIRAYSFIYSNVNFADLPNCVKIGSYSFHSSKIQTLILRSPSVAMAEHTNIFTTTPIKSGTGYIYVPRSLVDSYKAATNWSTYAAQFRALEDYTVDGTVDGDIDMSKI